MVMDVDAKQELMVQKDHKINVTVHFNDYRLQSHKRRQGR